MPRRRYQVDEHFFDEVDSEEKAYWLGFLMADGCVTDNGALVVRLKPSDSHHLVRLAQACKAEHPIRVKHATFKTRGKTYEGHEINIVSRVLTNGLIRHGVVPRKTEVAEVPVLQSLELTRHFVRGCFDGDGGFNIRSIGNHRKIRWHLVGNPPLLLQVQDLLVEACQVKRVPLYPAGRSQVAKMLMYNGNVQVRRIYKFMYEGATVWLPRKRELAESVLF